MAGREMARTTVRHTISILQVQQILQGARERGLDIEALLRRAGIASALLDSPLSRVTQEQYAALIRTLRRVMRDELWGLCSRPLPPGSFAQACRLMIHRRTLGDALREGFRFYRLLLVDFVPRLVVLQGRASVRMLSQVSGDARLSYAQRTFCFFTYGLASWLVARRIPVQRLMFRAVDLASSSEAEQLFQASIVSRYPWVGFEFQSQWLAQPIVQNAESLDELLQHAPDRLLLRYRDDRSQTDIVRRLLRRHLGGELPSLEAVSETIAVSPQTLRRRLRDEGQGFQEIKDELRRDAAIEYLSRPELTLLDVAARVGYSEASTFHRAFKSWTGQAPGVYRRDFHRSRRLS